MLKRETTENPESGSTSFLHRWSRRKTGWTKEDSVDTAPDRIEHAGNPENAVPAGEDAEISAPISPELLTTVLGDSRFNELDGLNEYDDDFTSFSPLGQLITHEMKRALANIMSETDTQRPGATENLSSVCSGPDVPDTPA